MYMRWKSRMLIKNGGCSLSAVLVEGKREGKRVKQIFIQHLGSIRQNNIHQIGVRIKFWESAEKKLSMLRIEPEEKDLIIGMLEKKVLMPSQKEIQKHKNTVHSAERKTMAKRMKQ